MARTEWLRRVGGIAWADATQAKEHFSEVQREVLRSRLPFVIHRQGADDEVVGIGREQLIDILDSLQQARFDPQVTFEPGEVVAVLPGYGVVGSGPTFESAMDDLSAELLEYASLYFPRLGFYEHTDRVSHYPALVRFVLTPPDERVGLLLADSEKVNAVERQEQFQTA